MQKIHRETEAYIAQFVPLLFSCKFELTNAFLMARIVIDRKKYVLIPEKEYHALQKKAALKTKSEKILSVEEARAYSKKLIRGWAVEK